jgi:hypothetical protein
MDAGNDTPYHSPQNLWIAHKRDAQLHSQSVCSWMCVHRSLKEMQQHQQQQWSHEPQLRSYSAAVTPAIRAL